MGDSIGSMFAGSPSTPDLHTWQPQYMAGADPLFWDTIRSMVNNNPIQQYQGTSQNILNNQLNNPYATGYQNASNQAGQAFTNMGNSDINLAGMLNTAAGNNLGYANQVAQMGLDPQNALYNRTLQQVQDQVRTSNAARGLNTSNYGANLENQALGNFNIDWQGQQLNRALSALSGYNSALGTSSNVGKEASNLGMAGSGALQMGGQVPYSAYNDIWGNQQNAIGQYGQQQLMGQQQQTANLGQLLQYLGLGANQSNAQAGLNQQSYLNQLQRSQAQGQMYGNMISGVGALMI